MMDASKESAPTLSRTDKLTVKPAASIDCVEPVEPTNTIRISNLPETMVVADLNKLLWKIGPTRKTTIRPNCAGLSEGFGFATFMRNRDAAKAVELLDGHRIVHRHEHASLKIELVKYKTK